jgi:hypothetical protein
MTIFHIINNLDHGGAEKLLLQMAAAQRARVAVAQVFDKRCFSGYPLFT